MSAGRSPADPSEAEPDDRLRWVVAVTLPVAALAVQQAFWDLISPFCWFLFFPPAFIAAWVGGLSAGLAATSLSALLVWFFFIPPERSFLKEDPRYLLPLSVFLLMGILFSLFHHRLRRTRGRLLAERIAAQRAADACAVSEMQLRTLVEQASDGIFIADLEGRYLDVNPAGCRLLGLPREEIVGRSIRDFVPAGDLPRLAQARQQLLEGEMQIGEWALKKGDGALVPVEVSARILSDGRWLALARDITRRKHDLQKERESMEAKLFQAQRLESLGRLAGGIAHDINNHLSAISLLGGKLKRRVGRDAEALDLVERIEGASETSAAVIRQLLAFSRKQVLQPVALDLNDLVLRVRRYLAPLLGEDVQVRTRLGSALPPVLADPVQVEQVVMNLAVNARDAMPRGGRLTIETSPVERDGRAFLRLEVSDTGHGMDEQTRQRIFDPFFTTKEEGKGTGLGLAVVHGIVVQSGGRIEVESEPGRGTTFRIDLPAAPEPARKEDLQPRKDPPLEPSPRNGKGTVLVVEDQPLVLWTIRETLAEAGYRVLEAGSGEQAVELCRGLAAPVDLLITDMLLPGIRGKEVAREVGRLSPSAQVIYTSGYPGAAAIERGEIQPGDLFLEKPFTVEKLLSTVREALGRPAQATARRAGGA